MRIEWPYYELEKEADRYLYEALDACDEFCAYRMLAIKRIIAQMRENYTQLEVDYHERTRTLV